MLAAPINPGDLNMIQGNYGIKAPLPAVGGGEGVGVIEEVGPQVKTLVIGQRVISLNKTSGTWRTHAVLYEDDLLPVSEEIPIEYAATISVNPCTAYRMLNDFVQLKPGDVIIQNGAGGMVGLALCQMAKAMGCITINILRPRPDIDHAIERLKQLGGDIVVTDEYASSYHFASLVSEIPKPKIAFNSVGGDSVRTILKYLAPGATLITYGGMSRKPITVPTSPFIFGDLTMKGFWMSRWYDQHNNIEKKQMIDHISDLIVHKNLILFMQTHPFAEWERALKAATTPFIDRKIVLDLSQPSVSALTEHNDFTGLAHKQ